MNTIKFDISNYLESKTFNIDNVTYKDKKVLSMNKAELTRLCKDFNFTTFLTTSFSQNKLNKGFKKYNHFKIGISLAPYEIFSKEFNINKWNKDILNYLKYNGLDKVIATICNDATTECKKNCVIWNSGNPAYINGKQNAMVNRKEFLFINRILFLAVYIRYIELYTSYCINNHYLLSIRKNIASDIAYEKIKIVYKNKVNTFSNIAYDLTQKTKMTNDNDIKDLKNYDYTKKVNRISSNKYKLVYSVNSFDNDKTLMAIKNKQSLAIIFNIGMNKELPKKYTVNNRVFKVIDADKNDYLGITNEQVIFGLRFKYKARDNKQTRLNKLNKAILNGFCRIA